MDPGDSSDAAWRLGQAFVEAERAFQRLGGPPTYGNLSSYKLLPKYAPALDLAGVSHYAVDAWAANGRGAHPLEDVYTYTLGLRYHTAPAPIWPWVQALCDTSWYENTGACWNRLPTPAEMRAQLYLELAAGAKGVLWYTYHPELVAQGAEQWQEVGRQNRLLGAVSDLFLYGDVAETVQVDQGRVLARAIVSERAVAIPVVNLDYDWEPYLWRQGEDPPPPSQPYRFRERSALSFSVLLPQWIQPQGAWAISPEGVTPLAWSSEARVLRFELAGLRDVALVVVGEEAVAEALSARLRP